MPDADEATEESLDAGDDYLRPPTDLTELHEILSFVAAEEEGE